MSDTTGKVYRIRGYNASNINFEIKDAGNGLLRVHADGVDITEDVHQIRITPFTGAIEIVLRSVDDSPWDLEEVPE